MIETVGDLKKALQDIPDDMPVRLCDDNEICSASIYECHDPECYWCNTYSKPEQKCSPPTFRLYADICTKHMR